MKLIDDGLVFNCEVGSVSGDKWVIFVIVLSVSDLCWIVDNLWIIILLFFKWDLLFCVWRNEESMI